MQIVTLFKEGTLIFRGTLYKNCELRGGENNCVIGVTFIDCIFENVCFCAQFLNCIFVKCIFNENKYSKCSNNRHYPNLFQGCSGNYFPLSLAQNHPERRIRPAYPLPDTEE